VGARGDDILLGGPDDDRLDGGPGNDSIDSYDGHGERVRCGPGTDSVRADPADLLLGCERRIETGDEGRFLPWLPIDPRLILPANRPAADVGAFLLPDQASVPAGRPVRFGIVITGETFWQPGTEALERAAPRGWRVVPKAAYRVRPIRRSVRQGAMRVLVPRTRFPAGTYRLLLHPKVRRRGKPRGRTVTLRLMLRISDAARADPLAVRASGAALLIEIGSPRGFSQDVLRCGPAEVDGALDADRVCRGINREPSLVMPLSRPSCDRRGWHVRVTGLYFGRRVDARFCGRRSMRPWVELAEWRPPEPSARRSAR
jgi:hypothetical protein